MMGDEMGMIPLYPAAVKGTVVTAEEHVAILEQRKTFLREFAIAQGMSFPYTKEEWSLIKPDWTIHGRDRDESLLVSFTAQSYVAGVKRTYRRRVRLVKVQPSPLALE